MRRPLERLVDFGTDAPARTGDPQIHNLSFESFYLLKTGGYAARCKMRAQK